MIIKNERPPIWDKAIAKFKFNPYAPVVFAWGDFIYNPNGAGIAAHLDVHESIHGLQQKAMGGPEIWWERYLADPAFRLEQEIEAYGTQARYLRTMMSNKKKRYDIMHKITFDLSSSLYGNLLTFEEAHKAIEAASMTDIKLKYAQA